MSNPRTAVIGPVCLLREGIGSALRRSGFRLLLEVSDLRILTRELWSLAETCSLFVVLSQETSAASTRGLIETLRRRVPGGTILVLCDDVAHDASELLKAGAVGCLPSTAKPDALIEALQALTHCTPRSEATGEASAEVGISRREWEVLEALSLGESNKHIGRRLGISDATVKAHIRLILKKTGCGNRTQAVLWALARRDVAGAVDDTRSTRAAASSARVE